ncbi:ribonuclease H-like domain-containing protein [Tanacetum coccineum]
MSLYRYLDIVASQVQWEELHRNATAQTIPGHQNELAIARCPPRNAIPFPRQIKGIITILANNQERVFLGDNLLSWSAKRQVTLSRSSAEAEYRGVANVVAEIAWIRNLLRELHTPLLTATLVYCDNVRVLHVPSRYQYADIFTKGLPTALFEEFRTSLSVRPSPSQTAREC